MCSWGDTYIHRTHHISWWLQPKCNTSNLNKSIVCNTAVQLYIHSFEKCIRLKLISDHEQCPDASLLDLSPLRAGRGVRGAANIAVRSQPRVQVTRITACEGKVVENMCECEEARDNNKHPSVQACLIMIRKGAWQRLHHSRVQRLQALHT